MSERENGWDEYQKLVLYRLDKLDERVAEVTRQQLATHTKVTQLRTLAGAWGAVAGALTGLASLFIPRNH